MTSSPAAPPTARLLGGDHGCWFFRSGEEHREGVTAFVRRGVESRAKVLYLADAIPVDTVAGYLRDDGLDPDGLVARGQLVLLSLDQGYQRDGSFDPRRQLGLYGEMVDGLAAEGYEGLWVTGEGTWEDTGDVPGRERSLEYEQLVERFLAGTERALALCQYDASAVGPHPADELRSVHNVELSETELRSLGRTFRNLEVAATGGGLAVSGEVDVGTWAAFSNALRRAVLGVEEGRDVVLDLGRLSFVDVHGLRLIVQAARTLPRGSRLLVRGAPPTAVRMGRVLGLDREPRLILEGRDGASG